MSEDPADIRARIRTLRLALSEPGENAKEFAKRIRVEYTTWIAWETAQRIGLDAAIKLTKKVDGLTLDWIYLGDEGAVPMALRLALRAAAEGGPDDTSVSVGRPPDGPASKKSSTISLAKSKTRRA